MMIALFRSHPAVMVPLLKSLTMKYPSNALAALVQGAVSVARISSCLSGDGSFGDVYTNKLSLPESIRMSDDNKNALILLVQNIPDNPVAMAVRDMYQAVGLFLNQPDNLREFITAHEREKAPLTANMGFLQLAHIFWPDYSHSISVGTTPSRIEKGHPPTGCLGNEASMRHILTIAFKSNVGGNQQYPSSRGTLVNAPAPPTHPNAKWGKPG